MSFDFQLQPGGHNARASKLAAVRASGLTQQEGRVVTPRKLPPDIKISGYGRVEGNAVIDEFKVS